LGQSGWSGQQQVRGVGTSDGPTLDGNQFSGQVSVPDVGTSAGPAVLAANGSTIMAWKGVRGDSGIWWSTL
jgi:hypothetical protein